MPFFYFDEYYLLFVLPAIVFAMICQWRVSSVFKKYAQRRTRRGITGADAARQVCGLGEALHVSVEPVAGKLSDHYDPKSNIIRLSEGVYGSASVAAVGVAAHEAGHAAQYAQGYGLIRLRSAIIPVTQVTSNLAMPLVMLGFVFSLDVLINLGILFFGVAFLFQLVTLPVEFNASRRALALLRSGSMLDEDELHDARKVLSAAALTYVAALAVSLAQIIRLILLSRRRSR